MRGRRQEAQQQQMGAGVYRYAHAHANFRTAMVLSGRSDLYSEMVTKPLAEA